MKGYPKTKRMDGKVVRVISIKLDDGIVTDENGFCEVDDEIQEELPFI